MVRGFFQNRIALNGYRGRGTGGGRGVSSAGCVIVYESDLSTVNGRNNICIDRRGLQPEAVEGHAVCNISAQVFIKKIVFVVVFRQRLEPETFHKLQTAVMKRNDARIRSILQKKTDLSYDISYCHYIVGV